jgi:hypothetical protein
MLRPSLNRMVLDALTHLQNDGAREFVTAREIKDYIAHHHEILYPIQTIIVVLNRFTGRGLVNRVTYGGEEVRQRYGYYLNQSSEEMIEEKIWSRFKAFADEFYQGDALQAVSAASRLIKKRHEPPQDGYQSVAE